jgi:hypothetical protein
MNLSEQSKVKVERLNQRSRSLEMLITHFCKLIDQINLQMIGDAITSLTKLPRDWNAHTDKLLRELCTVELIVQLLINDEESCIAVSLGLQVTIDQLLEVGPPLLEALTQVELGDEVVHNFTPEQRHKLDGLVLMLFSELRLKVAHY